jgi:hypothetical protein
MSNVGFFSRLFASITTSIRSGLWFTLLAVMAATSLIIVALTVTSDAASAPGTDAGRMAFSFVIFLVLVATLLGIPTVVISIREQLGRLSFLHTYLLTVAVGLSFVIVAVPAMLWAVLSTGVGVNVWLPTLGVTKLEVWAIALLVALAHWAVKSGSAATVTAFGLIAGVTIGPLVVVGAASFAPPIKQTTANSWIEYTGEDQPIDPATGYPLDPTCQSPNWSYSYITDYSSVWAAMAVNPLVFVSSSIEPAIGDYAMPGYAEPSFEFPKPLLTVAVPLDLFSSVDVAVRTLQIPVKTDLVYDECANLAEFGTAYPNNGGADPRDIIAESHSGFLAGAIGQGAFLVVASAILVGIRARTAKR